MTGSEEKPTDADWERLGRLIKDRREHLGLSQARVRELDGPSQPVQTQVENNDATKSRPRADSLHKFDKPLRWEEGSTLATLRGGNPTPIGSAMSIHDITDADLIAEVTRRLKEARNVVENAAQQNASREARQDEEDDLGARAGETPPADEPTTAAARTRQALRRKPAEKRER